MATATAVVAPSAATLTEQLAFAGRLLRRISPISTAVRLILHAETETMQDVEVAMSVVARELDSLAVDVLEWEGRIKAARPGVIDEDYPSYTRAELADALREIREVLAEGSTVTEPGPLDAKLEAAQHVFEVTNYVPEKIRRPSRCAKEDA
ncbi:MAG TPA: hypothetical protein VKQ05_12970 [Gemmatimonadales bacterium]|nr:hypothetical protein [Gemmatimonadales bacterium]